jgi:hypothetical protein
MAPNAGGNAFFARPYLLNKITCPPDGGKDLFDLYSIYIAFKSIYLTLN